MATVDEIIDEQNKIHQELERMAQDPQTTEDEDGNIRDTLVNRWQALEADRERIVTRMEELQLIRDKSKNRDNLEAGSAGGPRSPEFLQRHDPFEDLEKVRTGLVTQSELISRAQNAVEASAHRGVIDQPKGEEATRKARHPGIARHMLLYGSDDYVDAFRDYVNAPEGSGMIGRNLMLATASGGVMLPYQLDPTIVLTNSGSANPFRRLANVIPTTTNAYHGVSSAGVTAAWLSETSAAADATPTFGAITVYPKKAAAWVYGSFEAIGDTNFGDQLPRLLADAKDRLEEAAFAAGTGTNTDNTGQPAGIAPALGTATRNTSTHTGSGAFVQGTAGLTDVYNLQAKLDPRWRQSPSCAWVANLTTINKIRAIDQYGGAGFWANLMNGTPNTLLGQRLEESTSITVTTGTGATTAFAAAVYGDWSQYYILDRIGTQMLYEPMVMNATGTVGLPSGQSGWFMFWRVGAAAATASAFAWQLNGTA